MASDKYESDKQHFRCVPPCPRFVTGGDTHNCVVCLGAEHARSALKGDCPHCVHLTMRSVPGERSLRSALSPVLPTVRVPPSAEAERRLKSWGSQMDLAERLETGSSFSSSSPARSSAHSLEMEAHSETVSSTPREGSGSRYLPLRTRLVRSSIETRLWI